MMKHNSAHIHHSISLQDNCNNQQQRSLVSKHRNDFVERECVSANR